jgi:glutaminyl-peptide cyclotransferase
MNLSNQKMCQKDRLILGISYFCKKTLKKSMKKTHLGLFFILLVATIQSCRSDSSKAEKQNTGTTQDKIVSKLSPTFSSDSAYLFVEKQVAFGPRVPGTAAHKKCAAWLIATLKKYQLEVQSQDFKATLYNGKTISGQNIIASYNPNAAQRIIIASHWDSRPFADKAADNKTQAIDGANDGASGVGVILELARAIAADSSKPAIGIDFILFDAEDWGAPNDYSQTVAHEYGGYCLGSEYWSKNVHKANYTAYYGILLDMVGAPNATFRQEGYSMQIAPSVVANIWNTAAQLGYSPIFVSEAGAPITDDHVPVVKNLKIPMVDIIDTKPNDNTFFQHHHTHGDNMQAIDKTTLKAVGHTLIKVLYDTNLQ